MQEHHARQILQAIDGQCIQFNIIAVKKQMSEMRHVLHRLRQRRQQIVLQIQIAHLVKRVEE
ncbi:hypothetical protein D3C87_973220 [compost metagenome]